MTERVQTGGLMSFEYALKNSAKLSDERKREINEAYNKYHERKSKEKRNKIIFWITLACAVLLIAGYLILK